MLATVVQEGTAHPTVSTCDILRECSVLITPCLELYCSPPEGQHWRKKMHVDSLSLDFLSGTHCHQALEML